ncbi:MAG: RNA polymerase sigma factor, partial [Pyrinomonadaceae bacterium]
MAAYNITEEINSAAEVEFIDSTLPGLRLGTVKLEQKVGQLFERLRDPIYRYLVTTFGNPAEAEEITQEAFLRLYR